MILQYITIGMMDLKSQGGLLTILSVIEAQHCIYIGTQIPDITTNTPTEKKFQSLDWRIQENGIYQGYDLISGN